ncbi:MAG: PhzF family phenazine biosynthesis protein [Pseudomonadota bacterium]
MKLDIYQVDAFANRAFQGNPAAVVPLQDWLDDELMQAIAEENNLAETAFFVKEDEGYRIRWFTPMTEVDLCGHATLASAFVLYRELGYKEPELVFNSRSGPLIVSSKGDLLQMDFPAQKCIPCEPPAGLYGALGVSRADCLKNEDYLVVLENEEELLALQPDFFSLGGLDMRGVIVTSPAADYDFVNRFFAPNVGINEDPVTGSAFTKLVPYWADRVGRTRLEGKQVSTRGGEVSCELRGDRVLLAGRAIKYLQGMIEI